MRTLIDILPALIFFGVYKLSNIFIATTVLMIATVVQMLYLYFKEGRLQLIQKLTLALVLIFGFLTLFFHNDVFIKWKPTVLYGLIAMTLAVGLWGLRRNFIKVFLERQLELPDRVWRNLTISWIIYSLFMGSINAYVALYFSTKTWMDFKLWGYIFPVIFFVGQGIYLALHLKKTHPSQHDSNSNP